VLFLYNLGIRVYCFAISIASVFNKKARLWLRGRKEIFGQIRQKVDPASENIWFHCSSLGEFEQGRPVMEKIRTAFPGKKILLTFFSPSGYEIRKNWPGADYVFYLPADTRKNAERFIEIVRPSVVFFIKYEFWYHYLSQLKGDGIKTYLISGIFRPGQIFFRSYGKWFRQILESFTHLFVQDDESASLLKSIGFSNLTVCGDTRFDRVFSIAQKAGDLPLVKSFCSGKMTVVAGSTWPPDEEILIRFINEKTLPVRYIIVPHEIHENGIRHLIDSIKVKTLRYSSVAGSSPADSSEFGDAEVLVIDVIGILSSVYKYGSTAYIGGGFGKGIHNILEAATFGLPVIFGPNYQKFREAVDLVKLKGAFPVNDFDGFSKIINTLISDHQLLKNAGESAGQYVKSKIGATDSITKFVLTPV
jgi:3-deoxy-D-manno-octulosonic-acid transferase